MNLKNTFFLITPFIFVAFGFYLKKQYSGEDILLKAVNASLQSAHYDPVVMNDDFSIKAFNLYLKNIDGNKRYLLQSDVNELKKHELQIDDETRDGTYNLFEKSLEIMDRQTSLTEDFFEEILSKPFDFTKKEEVSFDDDIQY